MPYGLMVDGELRELRDASHYLLSPQDLCGVDHVPQLLAAGVRTFKVEGRLKSPEYVYVTTLAYRRAIDAAWEALQASGQPSSTQERPDDARSGPDECGDADPCNHVAEATDAPFVIEDAVARERRSVPPPLAEDALRQVFARAQDEEYDGHTPGFFDGPRHQEYVRGLSPSHRGVCAGTVVAAPQANEVRVRLRADLSAGDGVAFGAAASEAGGTLWGVHEAEYGAAEISRREVARRTAAEAAGGAKTAAGAAAGEAAAAEGLVEREVTLELEEASKLAGVRVGDLVWRTQHAALQRTLKSALGDASAGRALVDVAVDGSEGEALTVTVKDGRGRSAAAQTEARLQPATGAPLTAGGLRKAVGQLGGTPLMLRRLDVSDGLRDGRLWLPVSQIKEARRVAVDGLVARRAIQRVAPPLPPRGSAADEAEHAADVPPAAEHAEGPSSCAEASERGAAEAEAAAAAVRVGGKVHLSVLCRTLQQVEAAAACADVDEVVVDFLELDGVVEALAAARPKATVVAAPRIIKPEEEALWRVLLELDGADAILVRSAGLLMRLSALAEEHGAATLPLLRGDFSLNVANSQAAAAFFELHVDRLAPTFDLDAEQLCALADALPAHQRDRLEVIVHANVPIFHTEHCVFARTLSEGNSYKDCGHPCTRHSLHLVDEQQQRHHVLADSGCRNTVFNSQPQSAAPYLPQLLASGVRHVRIELTDQPASLVSPMLDRYAALCRGEAEPDRLLNWLAKNLVDSTGHKPGVTTGSFKPATERKWASLRPTAAAERAKAAARS